MIIVDVPIQYPYVEESKYEKREENALNYRDQFIKKLDYSKLIDAYYEITIGSSILSRLFLVKKTSDERSK
ncbi:hypothetical protein ATZ33_11200 [Enterococcus silesiacus]|uniref:Uncharacterized protein n=1 Tax=Enterococcus silesiacus TaxID=332949 RepID=A0A0S3KCG8_9ENTE|nr:hypothetical protein ATZ33_11200 [Enterococcus silesiacus]OJG90456.1 hypothetical protein RV15_GL001147 [Enterococcus silesiacus]